MEKDSPSKRSVAELAGKLKGHIMPTPNSNDELPFRGRPPCFLKFQNPTEDKEVSDTSVPPSTFKTKNSAIIGKLQANLALSPTALLPKGPDVKLQPAAQLSPSTPCSPLSPTSRPPHLSSEDEDPISFDSPPEGVPLPSFNKSRARLSFKRRPPTRQHRRSAGEEAGGAASDLPSPCEPDAPKENGDKDQVFENLTEEAEQLGSVKEAENRGEDCEKIEVDVAQSDPDDRGDLEQEAGQDLPEEASREGQAPSQPDDEQREGDAKTEKGQEETLMEGKQGENDTK